VAEGPERLIVEHLDGEVLVYDTERNEAHALSGSGAAEFAAAPDDVSRREVLGKMTLAGAAAAGSMALVKTIVAPTPAHAQSAVCGATCFSAAACAGNVGCTCCCVGISAIVCASTSACTSGGICMT
jgi:hypothetical protein